MLLNGNRNWNIPVYECLIRLNYHSQAGKCDYKMLLFKYGFGNPKLKRIN